MRLHWESSKCTDCRSCMIVCAERPKRLPTVLSKDEVRQVLGQMSGTQQPRARLLYGCGLRLMKCVQLRVKDSERM